MDSNFYNFKYIECNFFALKINIILGKKFAFLYSITRLMSWNHLIKNKNTFWSFKGSEYKNKVKTFE